MKKTLLLFVITLLCAILTVAPGCKKKENKVQSVPLYTPEVDAIVNYPFSFWSTAQRGDKVFWEFGDGATSSEFAPLHIYSSVGTYPVRLTANGESVTTTATVYHQPDFSSLSALGGLRYWYGTRRWHGRYGLAQDTTINVVDSPVELKVIDNATLCINIDTFRLRSIVTSLKYYYYVAYMNSEVTSHQGTALVSWCYLKYYYDENKITWTNHPFFEHLSGMTEATGTTTELTTP